MIKGYIIRHVPTGLFYCPSREVKNLDGHYVKSNLSTKGKVYRVHPSLSWIGRRIYTHNTTGRDNKIISCSPKDFEIIEVQNENVPSLPDESSLSYKVSQLASMLRNIAQGENVTHQDILDLLTKLQC